MFWPEITNNIVYNLFSPMLLFFYMGFLIPILRISFELPYVIYQALTAYLLIAIGWHGGEELAKLPWSTFHEVLGFIVIGFFSNLCIGFVAYFILSKIVKLRRIDAATIAGYYGSDSAGTFVTCIGILLAMNITFDVYMPVMLAVMEIPGCLVALYLVSRLRQQGMDKNGNVAGELGHIADDIIHKSKGWVTIEEVTLGKTEHNKIKSGNNGNYGKILHEVFFNPGVFLLFGGILIGFISELRDHEAINVHHLLFVNMFQGILCFFLLETGITASKRLRDLKNEGIKLTLFAFLAPNTFAMCGLLIAHCYHIFFSVPLALGTYVLFAVLCASASYIAVPAVQRLAIPEASPTLPLAASLGVTFSYNVTLGIPVYILLARWITS